MGFAMDVEATLEPCPTTKTTCDFLDEIRCIFQDFKDEELGLPASTWARCKLWPLREEEDRKLITPEKERAFCNTLQLEVLNRLLGKYGEYPILYWFSMALWEGIGGARYSIALFKGVFSAASKKAGTMVCMPWSVLGWVLEAVLRCSGRADTGILSDAD